MIYIVSGVRFKLIATGINLEHTMQSCEANSKNEAIGLFMEFTKTLPEGYSLFQTPIAISLDEVQRKYQLKPDTTGKE